MKRLGLRLGLKVGLERVSARLGNCVGVGVYRCECVHPWAFVPIEPYLVAFVQHTNAHLPLRAQHGQPRSGLGCEPLFSEQPAHSSMAMLVPRYGRKELLGGPGSPGTLAQNVFFFRFPFRVKG